MFIKIIASALSVCSQAFVRRGLGLSLSSTVIPAKAGISFYGAIVPVILHGLVFIVRGFPFSRE
jgi:hypothetical protein